MAFGASWDKTIRLWDAGATEQRGQELACLPSDSETYAAALSPDGRTVASAGLQGLTLWNWRDGPSFPKANPVFGACRALAYAPDGLSLAVGGFDKQIRIWDPKTQQVRAVLSGHRDVIRKLDFVADGSLLISLSFDGALKFWDVKNGREVDRLDNKTRGVHAFSPSPDGQTIALSRMGGSNCQIEVWDLPTNTLRLVCPGHMAEVHALTFSPDGRTLASAGGDQEIRFWDPKTGEAIGKVDRKVGWVRSFDFSKDGRWLAYSGNFAQVFLKRIDYPHRDPSAATHHS
jgi:WD40 repeat protein